jgi:hypothetical protein
MASQTDIQNLADLVFLSQNTGVATTEMVAAYEAVGLGSDAYQEANDLLKAAGYNPGYQAEFYGSNQAVDEGAKLLSARWQEAPTEEELAEAGLENMTVINSNQANSEWLTNALAANNVDTSQTSAITGGVADYSYLDDRLKDNDFWGSKINEFGSYDGATLDMMEWEELKKKKKPIIEVPAVTSDTGVTSSSNTDILNLGQGEVAPVQAVPQTVTQQVTPPSYYNQPQIAANTSISNEEAGTFSKPLQTAGLSAVPTTATYKTHYAGTPGLVDPTLVAPVGGGVQQVIYGNNLGQQQVVTEVNGSPTTYVPPGFVRKGTPQEVAQQEAQNMAQGGAVRGYASGGDVALVKLARMNGFKGDDVATARAFMNASEGLRNKVTAMGDLMGGAKEPEPVYANDGTFIADQAQRTQNLITQTMQPTQAPVSYQQPVAADFVPVDAGQATPIAPYAEAATVATVQQANQQVTPVAQTYDFTPAYQQVQAETAGLQPAQGVVSAPAQVTAQQQTDSAITGMTAATGVSTDVVAPAPREMQTGELIDPVADAASAAAFTEQVQAATATPSAQATVQGQLEGLMQQFEGGETPAWAAGSMRTAMATLSARGLGASSLAGQAVIQATMEAALPIAQMDAQVQAQFESQNLTNRQQRAMLSAQQRATFLGMEFDQGFQARVQNSARIGDIANMNFSAEQNIALENARAANTMNLNNLSNRQAMIMAEAAALSNLDMANLNNRQQAAVQNAQSFLQMDMTNLSNEQQTAIFKSQQNVQALFTDQAAENAAAQFNATSQNQTDQYFANLRSQTSQFNASQQNAMDQFNVNSVNALREFNSEIQQQRDLFNAQNGLLIAQSNAQWRQTVSTANTAAQNESNMNFAKTINALTATNLDAYWQKERDVMSFAYASGESAADRVATILQTELEAELKAEYQDAAGKGGLFATLLKGGLNYMGLSSSAKSALVV